MSDKSNCCNSKIKERLGKVGGQAVLEGVMMLLVYSLGLAIPFVISALLIDYLKGVFNWIKKHYNVINTVSGIILIVMGVLMATGLFNRIVGLLTLS